VAADEEAGLTDFECAYETRDGTVVVTPFGEIDRDTAPQLRDVLARAVAAAGGGTVDVTLGHVTFMDSSGIGALLAGHQLAGTTGTAFVVRDATPAVRTILEITNVWTMLTAGGGRPS
jgi:anti-anti-sigma factor